MSSAGWSSGWKKLRRFAPFISAREQPDSSQNVSLAATQTHPRSAVRPATIRPTGARPNWRQDCCSLARNASPQYPVVRSAAVASSSEAGLSSCVTGPPEPEHPLIEHHPIPFEHYPTYQKVIER